MEAGDKFVLITKKLRDHSNKKIFTVLKKDRSAHFEAERFVVFWLTPPFFKKK